MPQQPAPPTPPAARAAAPRPAPPLARGELPDTGPPPDLLPRIERLHAWFCQATGQQITLFGRERYWWAWINAGFTDEDLERVVEYLRREIRRSSRNPGALKLINLLDPERFEDDLNQTRLKASGGVPPIQSAGSGTQQRPVPIPLERETGPKATPEQLKRWAAELAVIRTRIVRHVAPESRGTNPPTPRPDP